MRAIQLNEKGRLLLLLPLVILAVPLTRIYFGSDRLLRSQRSIAGPNAIDCGISHSISVENNESGIDGPKVSDCAAAAFKAKKPFIMRNEEKNDPGTELESLTLTGVAGTADGRVFYFMWDNSFCNWWDFARYSQAECPQPTIENGYVECATCRKDGTEVSASCVLNH